MGQPCTAGGKCLDLDQDSMDKLNSTQISITRTSRTVRNPVQRLVFPILSSKVQKIIDNVKLKVKVIDQIGGYSVNLSQEGTYYQGQWQGNKKHGECRMVFPNGSYFQGKINLGKIEGFGILIHPNGQYYIGQFKNSMADGLGVYVGLDYYYQGEFRQNKQNGRGIYKSSSFQFDGIYSQGSALEGTVRKRVKKESNDDLWREYWYCQDFWKQKVIKKMNIIFEFDQKQKSINDQMSLNGSIDKYSNSSDKNSKLLLNEYSGISYRRMNENQIENIYQ